MNFTNNKSDNIVSIGLEGEFFSGSFVSSNYDQFTVIVDSTILGCICKPFNEMWASAS